MLVRTEDGILMTTLDEKRPISEQRYLMTIEERIVLEHVEVGLESYIPFGEKKVKKVAYIEDNETGAIACIFEDDIDNLILCLEKYRKILKENSA